MKRKKLIGMFLVVLVVLFLPVFKVVVVPSRTIRVVDEQGNPQRNVEVRQHWNHYSFDGSGISDWYGGEETKLSNHDGEISYSERSFYTSPVGWALATIGTPLRWINPHASTGPHSYLICLRESCSESGWYTGKASELENNVLTVESEKTIKERMDKIMETTAKDSAIGPANNSEQDVPPLPIFKKDANRR